MKNTLRLTENKLVELISKIIKEQEGTIPYELFMEELSSVAREIEYLQFDYEKINREDVTSIQEALDSIMLGISENDDLLEDEVNELLEFGGELETELSQIYDDKFGGKLFN